MTSDASAATETARDDAELASYLRDRAHLRGDDDQARGPAEPRYDEFLADNGQARTAWEQVARLSETYAGAGLTSLAARVRHIVHDDGIIYNQIDGNRTHAHPWNLDPIPLMIDGEQWADVEAGIAQRSRLLDALLRDVYGDQQSIARGLVAPHLVYAHPHYVRKAARLRTEGPRALFLHGSDVGRRADGRWVVFGDRTQAPSGVGYAFADRRLMARAVPRLLQRSAPRTVTSFAGTLANSLADYAPASADEPTIVVLSPGAFSETAFDQAYLASVLGYPMVEAADLVVRDGALFMRSLGHLKQVDVVLRRVDAEYSDPLDLRTDSRLGVAGLVEVISRGAVTVLNTLGSGVLENPGLAPALPELCRALLDEDLLLDSVETYWGATDSDPSVQHLLRRLDHLSITDFTSGEHHLGPMMTAAALDELRARITGEPWRWVGRTLEDYSVAPSLTVVNGRGRASHLRAAPVALRTFSVVQGSGYSVMPGGLGHVLAEGPSGSAMATVAAKDVWVTRVDSAGVASRVVSSGRPGGSAMSAEGVTSPRVLSDLFWLGRYSERAEWTTRMLHVAADRYQDYQNRPWMGGTEAVPRFLKAVGEVTDTGPIVADVDIEATPDPDEVAKADQIIHTLTVSRNVPGTVAYSVERLKYATRAVRDQMSTATWMVIAGIEDALADLAEAEPESDGAAIAAAHDDILRGLLAFAGLHNESMVHDPGWLFSDVGRRLERARMLTSLMAATLVDAYDPEVEQSLIESLLVAGESSVVYRRRYRGIVRIGPLTELMLFDGANPRSMIYQLHAIGEALRRLPEEMQSIPATRLVEDLGATLRRATPDDLEATTADGTRRTSLANLLVSLGDGLDELSNLLSRTRFAVPAAMQPIWGGGR